MPTIRFNDKKYRLTDFNKEVWVHCPVCNKQAIALILSEKKEARLQCSHCGFNKTNSQCIADEEGKSVEIHLPAHAYFDANLWFTSPFKSEVFWALNPQHLNYLEEYISAKLREHKERSHFTLLEKLPRFYHESKNRNELLKLIAKLRQKTS